MPIEIGSPAPDFILPATDGRLRALADIAGTKATLIVFACNHCPYVVAYEERLFALVREFGPQGLGAAFINANNAATHPADSFDAMVERVREKGHPCPYLHDEPQSTAKAYQAARTPEVFLFDADRKLAYHGGIDDNVEDPAAAKHHALRDAIEAVLGGRAPAVASTPAKGCTIKWK